MYITKNFLTNPLDQNLAEKILQLFLKTLEKNEPRKLPIENLSEEKIQVWFFQKKELKNSCIITLELVIQGEFIEKPTEGGFPINYYQYVKVIYFSSEDKELLNEIQTKFENFIEENKELPEKLKLGIVFNYQKEK